MTQRAPLFAIAFALELTRPKSIVIPLVAVTVGIAWAGWALITSQDHRHGAGEGSSSVMRGPWGTFEYPGEDAYRCSTVKVHSETEVKPQEDCIAFTMMTLATVS